MSAASPGVFDSIRHATVRKHAESLEREAGPGTVAQKELAAFVIVGFDAHRGLYVEPIELCRHRPAVLGSKRASPASPVWAASARSILAKVPPRSAMSAHASSALVSGASLDRSSVDVDVGGHVIRRGERVFAMLGSANHDEEVFDAPETLRLDRKPNRHLALGGGAHYCLGAPLARMEAQIAFTALLREAPALRLAVPRADVRFKSSMALRSLSALPVLLPRTERPRRALQKESSKAVEAVV